MLEKRLTSIERKPLQEDVKQKQLQKIRQKSNHQLMKQRLIYSTTLFAFGALLFLFIQTFSSAPTPNEQQNATVFDLGELKKATSLHTQRPEKIYNLSSPFYYGKLTTTDPKLLDEFEQLFHQIEMKPFDKELSQFNESTDYLFELKNGETIYLKDFYENGQSYIINPQTMMQLEFSEQSAVDLVWMRIYMEDWGSTRWKIVLIGVIAIFVVLYTIKSKRDNKKKSKNSVILNFLCLGLMYVFLYQMNNWLGVSHTLYLLLTMSFCMTLQELLYIIFKLKSPNWKRYLFSLLAVNGFVIILIM